MPYLESLLKMLQVVLIIPPLLHKVDVWEVQRWRWRRLNLNTGHPHFVFSNLS